MNVRPYIKKYTRLAGITGAFLLCLSFQMEAQPTQGLQVFKIKDNKMSIVLSRDLSTKITDSFISRYNLSDIGLWGFLRTKDKDSLQKQGWTIEEEEKKYVISKPLGAVERNIYPAGKIIFSPVPTPEDWREVGGNRTTYGYNQFENGQEFRSGKNVVYFNLKGFRDAKKVSLAGNFTNWQHAAFPMTKTSEGWTVQVKLEPGQYYYKFIIGDGHWITDPANKLSENDGRGNENSVFFVSNHKFILKDNDDAKNVFLAASFNNWSRDKVPLKKTSEGWSVDMYIEEGTYDYHYIVDGKTVQPLDREQQKLSIGKAHVFWLKGFSEGKKVILAGNFNDWEEDELKMNKRGDGWELPYVLGPGNYQYKYIVDGRWMVDPTNDQIVKDTKGNQNSFLVIGANYTFKLKGHDEAKNVFITGDFTNYSPEGIRMKKGRDGWETSVYLAKGKHDYSYTVDGEKMRDPTNKDWEFDATRSKQSVLWIDPNKPL
jgi:hypothetical protein